MMAPPESRTEAPTRDATVVLSGPHLLISARGDYQTLQTFAFTIGWPTLQLKAAANSGILVTMPLILAKPGECGSVAACRRLLASRVFSHAHWAKPIKKRCSGVKPSTGLRFVPAVAFFQAM